MEFDLQAPVIWLIVFALLIVIELVTMGLTTIWFAGGAIAAMIAGLAGAGSQLQIILFVVVSVVLMVLIRPWARKHFNHNRIRTNAQSLINETAIVIEDIDNTQAQGRVLIQGLEWAARTQDGHQVIPKGEQVVVREISGVKLIVELRTE